MEEIYFKTKHGILCKKSFKAEESLAFCPNRNEFSRDEYTIWYSAEDEESKPISKDEFDSAIAPYSEKLKDSSQDAEAVLIRNNSHPMYEHVHSSIAQRVEILAKNPYRFYLQINLWIGQSSSRFRPLNEYLKIALAQERYELCARIVEVKNHLTAIYKKEVNEA